MSAANDVPRITAVYRVAASAATIEARARGLALEQSVEAPLAAVRDARVRDEVVATVESIAPRADGAFDVTLGLAAETVGDDAGQLLNMLFGNSSLQADVTLVDADLPEALAKAFGGPVFGIGGLRHVCGATSVRPLAASALKPQGLPPDALAALAYTLAASGLDLIKDDHGLADQRAAPFEARVVAVQAAVTAANEATGGHCVYAPSLTGDGPTLLARARFARDAGCGALLVAPMVSGVANFSRLRHAAVLPLIAHPALAGVASIAPPLLLGRLFRVFGADATIFPNAGGRFGYSAATCAAIVERALESYRGLGCSLPVPAGGMTVERVPELVERFGNDAMLLIGGSLLEAGDALAERCRAFVAAVRAVTKPRAHVIASIVPRATP